MEIIEEVFEGENSRLDVFVSLVADISRSRAAQLLENGNVLLNGEAAKKNTKLKNGSCVKIILPDPEVYDVTPENIPLDIVFEDSDLLVVNKPKGMVVHPAAGNYSGTLVNALMYHCGDSLSGINGVMRPGIVHRIDKNTSGLLIVAKNDNSHKHLAEQIKEHSFTREYEAVVYGKLKNDSGTVNAPIARHPKERKQMAVVEGGREAVTHYTVIERLDGFTHIGLRLETGRTHQIRVHFASMGTPLYGDTMYGEAHDRLSHQALHCGWVKFKHPITDKEIECEAKMPEDMQRLLEELRK